MTTVESDTIEIVDFENNGENNNIDVNLLP